jgi:hypothetical protein
MAILTRKPKVDPAGLYVCLDSHTSEAGTYKAGTRLRGDHPAVKLHPALWIRDGAADDEIMAARHLIGRHDGLPDYFGAGEVPIAIGRPLTVADAVVCTSPLGLTGDMHLAHAPVAVGAVLAKTSPVVEAFPDHFRPATAADMPAA